MIFCHQRELDQDKFFFGHRRFSHQKTFAGKVRLLKTSAAFMPKFFLGLSAALVLSSCNSFKKKEADQASQKSSPSANPLAVPSQPLVNQLVKEQKKSQAALDIPIRGLDYSATIEKFGFASCLDQNQPTPILKSVLSENFDLFLMMGDNVYASQPEAKPISEQYRKLLRNDDFRTLRSKVPMLAIWDDHDYGLNDGGADNPEKEIARRDFLNFWPYVANTIPKDQKALYHTKIIGPQHRDVQFILLDTRWDRSPLKENPDKNDSSKRYVPTDDRKSHFLSEAQWQWLERELRRPARVKIIVSSIQLIANQHGFERWGTIPHERERFFDLVRRTGEKNVFVLSGDRHLAAIAKYQIKNWGTLYDITSSSINKSKDSKEEDSDYLSPAYTGVNYGVAKIDWRAGKISFEIHDLEGKVVQSLESKIK